MRLAIHDIYKRAGKQSPSWVDFDESSGWPQTGGIVMGSAHVSLIGPGVDPAAPETLRGERQKVGGRAIRVVWRDG